MKNSKKRNSKWEWYSVKNLFRCSTIGEPNNNKIDSNYSDDFMTYEESIVIVKAQSYDHAYKVAEKIAKNNEIDYLNPYDQTVQWRFIKSLDCFKLFDSKIKTGTELYSRFIHTPITTTSEEIIEVCYPEAIPTDDKDMDVYFPFRVKELNKDPSLDKSKE